MPEARMPKWFDKEEAEHELAKAEELYERYPKHVMAFTLAKLLSQRLVHPDLLQINLDMSNDIPLGLFNDAIKARQKRTNDRTEISLKS